MSKRKKEGAHFSFYAQWTIILQKSLIIAIEARRAEELHTPTPHTLPYFIHSHTSYTPIPHTLPHPIHSHTQYTPTPNTIPPPYAPSPNTLPPPYTSTTHTLPPPIHSLGPRSFYPKKPRKYSNKTKLELHLV